MPRPRVAVVGGGVSGLGAAWLLARSGYAVTVYEARSAVGGHARTVDLDLPGYAHRVPVDTGFIVYNTATYPDLVSLFETLRVAQDNSVMSFAASVDMPGGGRVEWGSDSLDALFADRRNLTRGALYTMLYDVRRFNAAVHDFVARAEANPGGEEASMTLADFIAVGGYSATFTRAYLVPMVACVWSASFESALAFPARTLFRFFVNHGLAQTFARPQWRTPMFRSRDYVAKVVEDLERNGGEVRLRAEVERVERGENAVRVRVRGEDGNGREFNNVVFGAHAPDVLRMLGDGASDLESKVLRKFKYADNVAYVHTDEKLMPVARGTWSAWNFVSRKGGRSGDEDPVCVSYWLNRLQNLNRDDPDMPDVFATLNPCVAVDRAKVLSEDRFAHPQFTEESVKAQAELQGLIQGQNRTWFCGAYLRYGFHEDGLRTGLDVAEQLMEHKVLRPWRAKGALAINNNYARFPVPFSSPKSWGLVFLASLVVTNAISGGIEAGLSVLAKRLSTSDPSVIVSTGNGHLIRCGDTRTSPGLISIRSPRLLARVTDAVRHHRDLVEVVVQSFVAGEIDCPTPLDLATALRALIVAQRKGPELGHGIQGQMHLAETLFYNIVGGFERVIPQSCASRLPELTTTLQSVIYPCWWVTDAAVRPSGWLSGKSGSRPVPDKPCVDPALAEGLRGPGADRARVLELLGELSSATLLLLTESRRATATVVVATPARVQAVQTKAKLLHVRDQVTVTYLDAFLESLNPAPDPYDRIIALGALNRVEVVSANLESFMTTLHSLLTSSGVAQLSFAADDAERAHGWIFDKFRFDDAVFCGDQSYRRRRTRDVLDAAASARLVLRDSSTMPVPLAVAGVQDVSHRVFHHLAGEALTPRESRQVLGVCALWEAALGEGLVSRAVVTLARDPAPEE